MQQSDETARGIQYLRDIIQSGKILKLLDPKPVNQGNSYLLRVQAFGKEWLFSLGGNQLNDLPGTKSFHQPALALAKALESRFHNVDPNYFTSCSGRLLDVRIDWPPTPLTGQQGLIAASGLWVRMTDLVTKELAKCLIIATHQQDIFSDGAIHFMRPAYVVNTIRSLIDQGAITFCRNQADLPKAFQPERMLTEGYGPQPRSVQDFVARKVWLLGLKAGGGRRETRVWIADPWDAAYLGCTEAELREAANVLDAQDKIVLREDGEFAQVGRVLLASEGALGLQKDKAQQTFQTIFDVYTPQGPIGEGGSGRVVRVTDEAGAPHALKFLKPRVMTTQKAKRFRNELAFCFRNTHRNIITVEDWGLAEIEGVQVPFYVMPAFPKTLRSVMEESKKPEDLIALFIQMLDGIEEAHKKGIWHRDLKPENILIDETNKQVVITDFGVAHFSELVQTEIETRPHERLANFRYAAPEQRSNGPVDHRADIYALGLILYEMLTAELLQGTSHLRIALIHPNLAALDQLVEWMSCQMPSDRPFSVGEIRDALRRALDEASWSQ
jgi:hypothetical protein